MSDNQKLLSADLLGEINLPARGGVLARRFLIPPFSVLNTRSKGWQDIRDWWIGQGIRSEMKRGDGPRADGSGLTFNMSISGINTKNQVSDKYETSDYGTSHFDPTLCHIMYHWHCPPDGLILDPFAGSSVSGVVAGLLGYRYRGIDLCLNQVEANREVLAKFPDLRGRVRWVHGDSREVLDDAPEIDLLFSCPPYHDLEVYSKDPHDLSVMDWDDFLAAYEDIIRKAVARLKDDRFAVITIGDVRDKDGMFRNLPALTTEFFLRAGMKLYNDAILVNCVGSLSVRTESQFFISRKFGHTHQYVTVYVKGDPRKATDAITGMTAAERRGILKKRAEEREKSASGFGWGDESQESAGVSGQPGR